MRKATKRDISSIMQIIRSTIEEMKLENNTQWDETYPQVKDFESDIEKGTLYVNEEDGKLKGFICVDYNEPIEYKGLSWSNDGKAIVIHRMAVNTIYRRQGIGTDLIKFANKLAVENDIRYIKTDTYSINKKMNCLFEKCGFKKIGEMNFKGKEKPFYCYDKLLDKNEIEV